MKDGTIHLAFKLCAHFFAHNLDRGGIRLTWLRENVHKRYLLHVTGHNLLLLRCQLIGAGTPREPVAGGYGCIFVLKTPTGAVLVAQIVLIVSEDGLNRLRRVMFRREVKPSHQKLFQRAGKP